MPTTIDSGRVREAILAVERQCADQVAQGAQTQALGPEYASCGQFFGEHDNNQRGLHGTAAALKILKASQLRDRDALLNRLATYVVHREQAEPSENRERVRRDNGNTIKKAELLVGVTGLPPTVHVDGLDGFRRDLANQLKAAQRGHGWSYFSTGGGDHSELLPTLFVLQALDSANESVSSESISYAVAAVREDSMGTVDFATCIFGIYVLLNLTSLTITETQRKALAERFEVLWRRHSPALATPVETNVQYSALARNYYVRIPWQLYLVALAAQLRPYARFATDTARQHLSLVLQEVEGPGFRYPHSGREVSSRTSAILVDVLAKIERVTGLRSVKFRAAFTANSIRSFLGSRRFRGVAALAAAVIAAIAIVDWRQNGGDISEIAPDLLASALALSLSVGRRQD